MLRESTPLNVIFDPILTFLSFCSAYSAYNTHLDQQQGYTQQAQQAAQRAAQISTNPYHDAPASSAYGAAPPRLSIVTSSQHQQQQQQAAYQAFDYSQRAPNASSSTVTNPPPVHHYSTSRGRSNTVGMQDVPPALRKIGHTLGIHAETGQSVTPVHVSSFSHSPFISYPSSPASFHFGSIWASHVSAGLTRRFLVRIV